MEIRRQFGQPTIVIGGNIEQVQQTLEPGFTLRNPRQLDGGRFTSWELWHMGENANTEYRLYANHADLTASVRGIALEDAAINAPRGVWDDLDPSNPDCPHRA
jgi:uncharacterized protein YfaS (alpha-2-macroglobulin family)